MNDAVDEVLRVCAAEGIDVDAVKGGELNVATNEAQLERLERRGRARPTQWGEPDYVLLDLAAAPGPARRRRDGRRRLEPALRPASSRPSSPRA